LYADDDYRRLAYEQGDMRPGGVAFAVPVPVETPFNHGERGCGDLSRRRVQYSNAAVEKLLSLQHARTLPAVCTRRFLSLLFSSKVKVKFSHTRYRALGPELIPVYRQSARR